MKIHATARDGQKRELEGRNGWTLMEILRDGGLDVTADCGGACACATCHVYIAPEWFEKVGAPSDVETDMLDMATAVEPTSRLSCQITLTPELDGLAVTVAPE